jgi:ribosomal protein L6P/L9E
MFLNKNNKYLIKIPDFILIFYFKKNNMIVFKTNTKIRFLFIYFKLNILIYKNKIFLFNNFLLKLPNNLKKKLNSYKKIILAFFKQFLIEMQVKIYSKLKFIGIGYKLFLTDYKKILLFKLGYSHSIYLKLNFDFFNLKFTRLFIVSNFYKNLMKITSLIRTLKFPEPYKGKGILYQTEKIKIKEIKKTK